MDAHPLATDMAGLFPGGLVLVVAAVVAVGVFLLVLRAESLKLPVLILAVVGVLVVAYGLLQSQWQRQQQQADQGAWASLAVRANALEAAAATSGLACLDASADMTESCEAVIFARPETVAAARTLVRARLALLADAAAMLRVTAPEQGSAMPSAFGSWRPDLEADPYGLVAVVLTEDFACGNGDCEAARATPRREPLEQGAERFATLFAKHAELWRAPPVAATPEAATEPSTEAAGGTAPTADHPAPIPTAASPGPASPGAVAPAAVAPAAVAPAESSSEPPAPPPAAVAPPATQAPVEAPLAAPPPVAAPQATSPQATAPAIPVPTAVVPLPPRRPPVPRAPVIEPAPEAPPQ